MAYGSKVKMPYGSKVKRAATTYKKAVKTSKPGEGKRFSAGSKALQAKGKTKKSADAIMASVGRKKYGAKKFASMASKGRKSKK